jgi:hypothetical protein
MPDWENLIAERLAGSGLAPEVQREVVAEIAAHLEEGYLELRRAGHADAEQQMLAQVSDWRALCRNIRRSKENPMGFTRNVVVPGLAAVILSQAALRLYVYLLITPEPCGPDMTCIAITAEGPAYLPWLATLPLAGATAAWLARLAGARSMQRLLAAVSLALYLGVET